MTKAAAKTPISKRKERSEDTEPVPDIEECNFKDEELPPASDQTPRSHLYYLPLYPIIHMPCNLPPLIIDSQYNLNACS